MTFIIIGITALFSIIAFSRRDIMYKFQFNAYQVFHRKEWYRIFTHAVLHADYTHLIVNMIVLFSFGRAIEMYFSYYFGNHKILYFLLLYIGGILVSSIFTLLKHRNNPNYNAVGASGAVSAVVFASVFFAPLDKVLFFGILPIPGILFGALYLGYSYYMSKKNVDNIGHDAHFWGAVYGFLFPLMVEPKMIHIFISQLFG